MQAVLSENRSLLKVRDNPLGSVLASRFDASCLAIHLRLLPQLKNEALEYVKAST